MFEDLVILKDEDWPFDPRTETLDAAAIADLRRSYPRMPNEYFDYLGTIGGGSLANGSYMIYGGPVDPDWVYGRMPDGFEDVVLVGDDFAGGNSGIRLSDGVVVKADPGANRLWDIAPSFEAFIRAKIAEFMSWRQAPAQD